MLNILYQTQNHIGEDKEQIELINMITLSKLIGKAALLRQESRGGHYRDDYPSTDKSFKVHINFQNGKIWTNSI